MLNKEIEAQLSPHQAWSGKYSSQKRELIEIWWHASIGDSIIGMIQSLMEWEPLTNREEFGVQLRDHWLTTLKLRYERVEDE